jgi:uncharacterized protein
MRFSFDLASRLVPLAGLLAASLAVSQTGAEPGEKIRVLIVDGMNNHDWARNTRILKAILEKGDRFAVDVSTTPPTTQPSEAGAWDAWRPRFADYQAVFVNFNGGHNPKTGVHWPGEVEKSLEEYVTNGGGLVVYHAANNSFPNWAAYNEMIGLGWRPKEFGKSITIDKDEKLVEIPAGQGLNPGHPKEHDFQIRVLKTDHPITQGMPKLWLHPYEQLTHGQHGPAKNMTILTYAWADDVNENEPMDWVVQFGKGRVYVTMQGHLWKEAPDTALRCAGFRTLLMRGVEWAATGKVTIPIPDDFPTADQIRLRESTEK